MNTHKNPIFKGSFQKIKQLERKQTSGELENKFLKLRNNFPQFGIFDRRKRVCSSQYPQNLIGCIYSDYPKEGLISRGTGVLS